MCGEDLFPVEERPLVSPEKSTFILQWLRFVSTGSVSRCLVNIFILFVFGYLTCFPLHLCTENSKTVFWLWNSILTSYSCQFLSVLVAYLCLR